MALPTITLRNGETVEAGIVRAPDEEWRERIVRFLSHKGDLWNWQNDAVLSAGLGMEVNFYVAHRGNDLISTMMTVTLGGAGIFGHVYTLPAERGGGAASALMEIVMADFRARGGKALFLDTDFGSTAYRIYERNGFASVEPFSPYMAYYAEGEAAFNTTYFAGQEVLIQHLGWHHWSSVQALFIGDFAGQVRAASLGFIGRMTTETGFLPLLRAELERRERGETERAYVLFNGKTQAVVGFAMWDWHRIWPRTCLIDVYCHPDYWQYGIRLLDLLLLPKADRYVVYADAANPLKCEVLQQAGFAHAATLPGFVREGNGTMLDVLVFTAEAI